jgi:hypothetical protein
LIEGSIRCFKSAVDLSIYRGGGLDPLQTNFRVNPANLANNRSTKLGTLNCSAHARTVRPPGADRLDRGPSGLRAGPSALLKMGSNSPVSRCCPWSAAVPVTAGRRRLQGWWAAARAAANSFLFANFLRLLNSTPIHPNLHSFANLHSFKA